MFNTLATQGIESWLLFDCCSMRALHLISSFLGSVIQSFNSNICNDQLCRKKSTFCLLGFWATLLQYANFSKFYLRDAYKNVKYLLSDYRIQGFSWIGKFFYDNHQNFGVISTLEGNFAIKPVP